MSSVFLKGERIHLRALLPSDADGPYVHWLNDAEVCSGNSHHRFTFTKYEALEYIQGHQGSKSALVLAITANESGEHIGNIALQKIDWVNRTAEFAILLGEKSWWGKGVGREAGELVIRHGFETLNLNRIECGTFSSNEGMIKLAHSLGMTQEGCRRQAVFKDGEYLDVLEFGVLRGAWSEGRA